MHYQFVLKQCPGENLDFVLFLKQYPGENQHFQLVLRQYPSAHGLVAQHYLRNPAQLNQTTLVFKQYPGENVGLVHFAPKSP